MAKKYCRKFQPSEQDARTLQTDRRQTDLRYERTVQTTFDNLMHFLTLHYGVSLAEQDVILGTMKRAQTARYSVTN